MNELTPFGKELRKMRIDNSLRLKDMASTLDVSSSFLSAIEYGRKPLSSGLTNKIVDYLERMGIDTTSLLKVAAQTINSVSLNNLSDTKREVVNQFARTIEDIPDSKLTDSELIEEFLKSIRKGK